MAHSWLCAERSLLEVLRRPYALRGIESIINQLHKRCILNSHTMSPALLSTSPILFLPQKPTIAENLASDAWQVLWHWKPLAVLATTSVWLLSSSHVLLTWLSSMKLMWLSCTGLLELRSWKCPNLSQSFLQLLLGFSPHRMQFTVYSKWVSEWSKKLAFSSSSAVTALISHSSIFSDFPWAYC